MGNQNNKPTNTQTSKKLVNDPVSCVKESLKGYVLTHRNVKLLGDENVVLRHDIEDLKSSGNVAVITGGGSGHEPFAIGYIGKGGLTASVIGDVFAAPSSIAINNAIKACYPKQNGNSDVDEGAGVLLIVTNYTGGGSGHEPAHVGYIGDGMLTAAVCGDVFTSPSSSAILGTIRACTGDGGVLLVVKNYTGDRLNFGKAAEVAKGDGIDVEMVVVADDCALTSKDKSAGRRGLCGTIFIHKMAGAMSAEGKTLKEMTSFLRKATKEIGTISISLSPCSIPGKPPNFTIKDNVVEFGLGIHGEPGVSQIKMETTAELVAKMLDHVKESGYLPSLEGKEVALIVNNLGGTSNLELSIVAKEAIDILDSQNVAVKRCYVGAFVTSMEMAGVSLTVMVLNEDRLKYLDADCDAPAWLKNGLLNTKDDMVIPCALETETYDEKAEGNGLTLFNSLKTICTSLVENEEKLNDLDRAAGDGDTGTTVARGANCILKKLSDAEHVGYPINNESQLCLSLAKDVESSMGGSSGALISLLLTAASNAVKTEGSLKTLMEGLQLGIDAMKTYGGAEEGDRTMLDALSPTLNSLKESVEKNLSLKEALQAASKEARAGATATKDMKAKAGRSSYVADSHLTQPDPGAYAVALVFEAIEKAYTEKE